MDEHAIHTWDYLIWTVYHCRKEALEDADFARLALDMRSAYPKEYKLVMTLMCEGGGV